MTREYQFEFPVKLTAYVVSQAPHMLQAQQIWDTIPQSFQDRIAEAAKEYQGLEITREELDAIDDTTWARLMELLQYYI